jgi:1-acyl-sn-glycerol-3-phosphate acyltransferase
MRALLKWLGIIPLVLSFGCISGMICLLPVIQKTKHTAAMRVSSFFSGLMLRLLGVRVHVKHRERLLRKSEVRLIVSNHLSYIDVLILSSLMPVVFVASVELKHTAVIGLVARLSGSLFVERRRPSGLKREIADIAFVLGQGLPVALFPEGTTSNGDRVHPFKNSLFDAAVVTRADIVPLCLRYTKINGRNLTPQNRDDVFYYGGISFFKHLPRLLSCSSIEVEALPLAAIMVQPHHTRKDLAALTQSAISAVYHG